MNIVIAGIKRSGSTAQYNMVRLVLEYAGIEYNIIGHDGALKEGNNIVKRHPFSKKLYNKADHIFTTDREDVEIRKSMKRMGWECDIKKMRKNLNLWNREAHKMQYTHIVEYPLLCIETIAHILGVDTDCNAVLEAFKDIKPPINGQDPVTLLFKDHVHIS